MTRGELSGRHAVVTGGSGYIGSALAGWLDDRGCEVTVLARRRPGTLAKRIAFVPWRIGDAIPPGILKGGDLVFHLAHDWAADTLDPAHSSNLQGTIALLDAARAADAGRVIFASSQLAAPDSLSHYARVKHAIETRLHPPRETAVRIGFVYGGTWGGPAGRMMRMVRRAPVVPVPSDAAPVSPVHIDDLCAALADIALSEDGGTGPRFVAGPEKIPLSAFARTVGRDRFGRICLAIPVPAGWFSLAARCIPPRLAPSLRDRLAGLGALADAGALQPDNPPSVSFRTLDAGLAPDRQRKDRRALIREAAILIRWIAGAPPSAGLCRRYARSLAAASESPLPLPAFSLPRHAAIRIAQIARRDSQIRDRLGYALHLAEQDPGMRAAMSAPAAGRAVTGMVSDILLIAGGKLVR